MAAWVTITADDLNDYQVAKIINAARTKALATGQTDPFPKVMADVIKQMRDDIAENPAARISATANTVPPSLRGVAILLIIEAMQGRLPGINIQDDLKDLIKDAKARMLRISRGKPVEFPDDPIGVDEVQRAGDVEIIGDRPFKVTREALSSL